MYNRYIRSETGEVAFENNFVPVTNSEDSAGSDYTEADENLSVFSGTEKDTVNSETNNTVQIPGQCDIKGQNQNNSGKRTLSGILKNFNLNFNAETIIVIGIALFLLCDNIDDSMDSILLLLIIIALGF